MVRTKLLFFCDESSQTADKYMSVSGIALRLTSYDEIVSQIRAINESYGAVKEVKWSNFKKRRKNVHKAYVDYLFSLIEARQVHFHVLIREFSTFDHSLSGPRKRLDSVSKMFYQLLLYRAVQYYGHKCEIYIRPDDGPCTEYLPNMLVGLNSDAHQKFGIRWPPVRSIEPRDSKREPLLNLNDVTLGAISAFKNGRHNHLNASEHKTELARYVLQKTGLPHYDGNTPARDRAFTLWNHRSKRGPQS